MQLFLFFLGLGIIAGFIYAVYLLIVEIIIPIVLPIMAGIAGFCALVWLICKGIEAYKDHQIRQAFNNRQRERVRPTPAQTTANTRPVPHEDDWDDDEEDWNDDDLFWETLHPRQSTPPRTTPPRPIIQLQKPIRVSRSVPQAKVRCRRTGRVNCKCDYCRGA